MADDENGTASGKLLSKPHKHSIEPVELDNELISRCMLDELPYTGGSLKVPARNTSAAGQHEVKVGTVKRAGRTWLQVRSPLKTILTEGQFAM